MTERGLDFVTAPAYGMPPPPGPGRGLGRRWLRWMAVTVGLAVGGAVVAARPLLAWGVKQWAAVHGMTLSFDRMELATGEVALMGVRVTSLSFAGLEVTAPRATFHVKHLTPEAMVLASPRVSFDGTPAQAVDRVLTWTREQHAELPPVVASDVSLVARAGAGAAPWLQVSPISVSPGPGGTTRIRLKDVAFQGHRLGSPELTWQRTAAGGALFQGDSPAASPVALVLPEGKARPTVRLEAHRLALRTLDGWVSVPAAMNRVELDGSAEVSLLDDQSIDGNVQVALLHYTPPVPAEVSALVSSDRTTVRAGFRLPAGQRTATVTPLAVTAGKLSLQGSGSAALEGDHGTFRGTLNGSLACKDVARSAAANVGGLFGGLLGTVAEVAVQGNLLLSVRVEADSRHPDQASFVPTVTARCGAGL